MKRKLSALLAIVLVVVMVFPTAVFVGAADATEISISYTGSDGNSVSVKNGDTIRIPVHGSVQLNVSATGYTVEGNRNGDEDGKVTFTKSTNTFTGNAVNGTGTSFTYTATATGKKALTPVTFTVVCELPEITKAGVGVVNVNGSTTDYSAGRNQYTCATGTAIKTVELTGMMNNGKVATFDYKLSLTGSDYDSFDKTKGVVVNTKSKTLYVRYEAKDTDGNIVETDVKEVYLDVTGHDIANVYVKAKNPNVVSMEGNSITTTQFEQYIEVYTETTDGYSKKVTDGYNLEYNITGTSITKDNFDSVKFTVKYDNVSYPAQYAVSDYITFDLPEISTDDVVITLSLKKNTYIEGQTASTSGEVSVKVVKDNKDITDQVTIKNVTVSPFVYNQNYISVTCKINGVEYTKTVDLPRGITIDKKTVVSITESSKSKMKKSYDAGDKLDLSELIVTITYNNGDTEDLDYNVKGLSYSPANGKELTADDKNVRVSYDVATGQAVYKDISITVTANTKTSIKEVKLLSSSSAKKDYFIGEAFDPAGFEVLIVYSDASTKVIDLKDYKSSVTVNSSKYDTTKKQFTAAMDGDLPIKFSITHNSQKYEINLTLTGIKVTKRPLLTSIVATTSKTSFMEGDTPRVCDFTITAKYDDNTQRVFTVDAETTGATKSTYTVTKDSVYYTVKLTPTSIDSDTKSIRVTYSEKTSEYGTKTFYDDIEIEVTVPDAILTYYDNTTGVKAYVSKAYEDFYEALKDAEKIADEYGSTYTSSYYSRVPEIQLRRDVTMSYDFDTTEDMKIDLNGHNLTMIRGELSVSTKAPTDTEVVFTNTNKTDAKLIYSTNEDDTIILGEDNTFTIDRSSGNNKGKYDVTISSVKNGKVEGPREVTHGHDAKFTITPDENYKIKSISVKEDKATKKYTETDGVVTVEDVQGDLTITVTFEEKAWDNPFTDVYKSATYYKSIQFVYENGLFSGMSATKFEPDTTMTRAMFVTVLGRLADVDTSKYTKAPDFTDVSTTDASISYAIPYIQWAVENDLIQGYGNGKFGPKDNITHIQMYVLMQRYASYIEKKNTSATTTTIAANDVSDIPTWTGAYEAVQYAAKYDFLVTSSNRITPNGDAKRSELAMLLEKFCDKVLEWNK